MYFHAHIRQQKYSQVTFYCKMREWFCSRAETGEGRKSLVSKTATTHN